MKKKYLMIIPFFIAIMFFLSSYSYSKFKTYNFILSIHGAFSITEESPTYDLKNNIILIKNSFKETYINYLTQIYETKNWDLEIKDENTYVYCDEKNCDTYKFYHTDFFAKKFTILIEEMKT